MKTLAGIKAKGVLLGLGNGLGENLHRKMLEAFNQAEHLTDNGY